MNKKILWLLLVSLAANVFLGVVVGTHAFHGPKGPPPRPERILDDMASVLPSADAQILRQAMKAHGGDLKGDGGDPRRHFDRMRQILSADPFDVAAFARVNDEFRAGQGRMIAVIGDVLTEALPRMSPAGRKRLVEFLPGPK